MAEQADGLALCKCGHQRYKHEEEMPYECTHVWSAGDENECFCQGFTYPKKAKARA